MPQFKPDFGIEKPEKKTVTFELVDYYIILICTFSLGCVITGVLFSHGIILCN